MANNRIYLRCKCGKGGACIAKFYPTQPWYVGRPTPRGVSENPNITDEMRCKEYVEMIDEFLTNHSHNQDSDLGGEDFYLEYESKESESI